MKRLAIGLVGVVAVTGGCKKKEKVAATPMPGPAVVTEGTAEPLPGGAPDGTIGAPGAAELVGAADDGSWVLLCQGAPARLRVVVGDGPGLVADRAVAATDRDLIVVDGGALVHVDVAARTSRRIGAIGPVVIDPASRRIVHAIAQALTVRDPGVAPRLLDAGKPVAAMWLRGRRWLEVAPGEPSFDLRQSTSCAWVRDDPWEFPTEGRLTIDLDPAGVEAVDRIGPELGITGGGEITIDGTRVLGAECVGQVIAALADPPRALVACSDGNHVVGPGVDRKVGGTSGGTSEQATISDQLVLGQRLVCVSGACVDLVSGRDFSTWETPAVWRDERYLVRKAPTGLLVDDLAQERQRTVVLPRLTQAVTVDTATGRRRASAAPTAPAFIDAAGDFLLYGRHVVDVDRAALVATLGEDALAIDRSGRVLIADTPGAGPLRWKRP